MKKDFVKYTMLYYKIEQAVELCHCMCANKKAVYFSVMVHQMPESYLYRAIKYK